MDFAPAGLAANAQRLFALHRRGSPLRLLNAWDAGSARLFEAHGAAAIGTTSAGVAFALGRPDGAIGRDEMLEATARIAAAVNVPVTADIESGFGETPGDVGETVERVLAAGAVGINLEDAAIAGDEPLRPTAEAAERIAAARAAAERAGLALFVNARTDVYWLRLGDESSRLDRTIERLAAYVAAGADGVFAPGVTDRAEIARLSRELSAPLNLLAGPSLPPLSELAELGVARVSSGSAPSRALLGHAARIADEFIGAGAYAAMTDGALPYDEANMLFTPRR